MAILWGSDLIFIYNDGYRTIAADKHPCAMGRSTRDVWPEAWEFNKPIFERVMRRGESVHLENQVFRLNRQGEEEDAYFTLCYSPIRDERANIAGTLVVLVETTGQVLLEQQLKANRILEAQIAAQKRAEEALRASREAFRALADNSPDNIDRLDRESRHLYVNLAAARLLGLGPKDIVGKTNRQLGTPEPWASKWEDRIRQTFDGGQPIEVEDSFPTKEGIQIWQTRCVPERASDGTVASVLAVSRDITERKKIEEALWKSEELSHAQLMEIESIYDSAPIGMCVFDRDLRYTRINRRLAQTNGISAADHIGKTVEEVVPSLAATARRLAAEILRTGKGVTDVEFRGTTVSQSKVERIFLENWLPLEDSAGEVVAINVVAEEITERKRAENALRQSEERLRLALEAAGMATWDWNLLTDQVIWNDEHYRLLGYTVGERRPSYKAWADRLHPGDLRAVEANLRRSMNSGSDYSSEFRTVWPDESIHHLETRGRFERDNSGRAVRSYGVMLDITHRKQMEEALRQSHAELELRVQERTRELSGTVLTIHERSEQLQRMAAELVLAEERERRRLAQVLHDGLQQILVGAKYRLATTRRSKNMQQVSDRVVELIDEAIETSRSLTVELSPPILLQGDLLSSLRWLAHSMHDRYGLDVNVAGEEIQPLTEAVLLMLFQGARELLFNVVKHAGVKAASVELNQLKDQTSLIVKDEGAGFDTAEIQGKKGQSGGLGLFGINERLSYMGGRMEISSVPGRGSRFELIVPHSAINAEADRLSARRRANLFVATSPLGVKPNEILKKIRIVLVDDHLTMREGLAGLLRMEPDFEVVGEASDGESAVCLIRELRPDIVLMDISMPGMDGIEATRITHSDLPEVRIIGLSMFKEGEQQAAMRKAGAVDCLTKSGPSEALIETIRTCCR